MDHGTLYPLLGIILVTYRNLRALPSHNFIKKTKKNRKMSVDVNMSLFIQLAFNLGIGSFHFSLLEEQNEIRPSHGNSANIYDDAPYSRYYVDPGHKYNVI